MDCEVRSDSSSSGASSMQFERMLAAVVRAVVIATSLGFVLSLFGKATMLEMLAIGVALPYALALVLMLRRGYFVLCAQATVFGLIVLAGSMAATYGSARAVGAMAFLVAVMVGGIFLERRALTVAVVTAVCTLGCLVYAQNEGWLPTPNYQVTATYWAGYAIVITFVAVVLSYIRAVLLNMFHRLSAELGERRKVEAAGRQSDAKYAAIFGVAPDPIVIARERDGVLLEINEAWIRSTGYSREQTLGRSPLDLALWSDNKLREEVLARLKAEGSVQNFPVRFNVADGRSIEVLLSGIKVMLESEPCIVWSWRDITALKRAEQEVHGGRHLLETVIDALPMSVFAKDLDSKYILLNKKMAEFFGMPKEQLLGQHTSRLPNPSAARIKSLADDEWVFRNRRTLDQPDVVLPRPDGTPVPYHSTKIPLFDRAGNLMGLLGINRDISEEKRAQDALRESEQRFRAIFERSKAGIATWGRDGRFLTVNSAFCDFVGYAACQLVGRMSAGQLRHPGEEDAADLTGRMLKGEITHVTRDRRYRRSDGSTVWGRTTVTAVNGASGVPQYFVAVVIDITEARAARERMEGMNAELEQRVRERTYKLNSAVEKLEEANRDLDSFNFSIAHDLRQPLNVIGGFADLLQEPECVEGGGGLEFAREIYSNASRMEQMIEALLRFSNVGRGALNKARVDMREQVDSVLRDLGSGVAPGVEISVGDLPPALGDASLLRHVWANLISNALKYSGKTAAPKIEIRGSLCGNGNVEYVVRDNGIGFDMLDASHMFGVFERLPTSEGFEGTGVGLAIVQRILRRHGGRISAESEPGRGATFSFTLRAWSAEDSRVEELLQNGAISRLHSRRRTIFARA